MALILEGPDHVGKTTFAQLLVDKAVKAGLPAYYAHMSTPPPSWNYYGHYIDRLQRYAVQDRFHLGGITYGNVCRGGTKITRHMLDMLNARVTLQGGLTCILYSNSRAVDEDLRPHMWLEEKLRTMPKTEKFTPEQIISVNAEYIKLVETRAYYSHNVAKIGYPGEKEADYLIYEWTMRLKEASRRCEVPAYWQNENMT